MLILEDVAMAVEDHGENKEILKGISVEFKPGKLYGITGPNGGGKTSLAKVIMGIYKNTGGKIYLNGEEISSLSVTERARKGIAYAFQQPPRFKGITVQDLLKIANPDMDEALLRKSLRDVGLCPEDYLERELDTSLSGGEIKRIEIAQVLARRARISIFDEPEAGVDLWTIQKLIHIIMSNYKEGSDSTAIIITHNENVLPVCDEIIVIKDGVIDVRGRPDQVWPFIRDEIECKRRMECRGEMVYGIE
ncbi:Fe-S cluster assembly ATP-binding protein [Thermosyntropha lipolytica DSM 11003]|uniref:Fe-S cluster assembly ATP-binding protein n=1 Tax=Thermosyntropha lipolytica DSM 11003 TaxID=1123382 RepID=A0A1M5ND25_9FIRM|nr:ATP-binding cassette domain-containing protein [Thermosyntropha lipolytica]SHG87365.1 Fe-S cluster assembly ATP-binding protein [Thermosyntropha lipolytica DSM 11003]